MKMATFTTKAIIDDLIKFNGKCEDDPDVALIVEYTTPYGNTCWGVTWVTESRERQLRYLTPSPYVINPHLLWER